MEKKFKVTIEITEKELPIILRYSNCMVKGSVKSDVNTASDKNAVLDICKEMLPEFKSLMYKLGGATIDALGQFHRDALILMTKLDEGRDVAKEAERWSSHGLGLTEALPRHAYERDVSLRARMLDWIAEQVNFTEEEIIENIGKFDLAEYHAVLENLLAEQVIERDGMTSDKKMIYHRGPNW